MTGGCATTGRGVLDHAAWEKMSEDDQNRLVIDVLYLAHQERDAIAVLASRRIFGATIAIAFCDSPTTYQTYVNIQHTRKLMKHLHETTP